MTNPFESHAPLPKGMPFDPSRLIGPWYLEESLTQGEGPALWRARHRTEGHKGILADLGYDHAPSEASRAAFVAELTRLAELKHPFMPRCIDYAPPGQSSFWVVLEHRPGRLLSEVLKDGELAPEQAKALGVQVLGALYQLHQLSPPLVLGDLAPETLLLGDDNQLSFVGLVHLRRLLKLYELSGTMDGVGYLTAEQLYVSWGPHLDRYAVAMLLVSMLTGLPASKMRFRKNKPFDYTQVLADSPWLNLIHILVNSASSGASCSLRQALAYLKEMPLRGKHPLKAPTVPTPAPSPLPPLDPFGVRVEATPTPANPTRPSLTSLEQQIPWHFVKLLGRGAYTETWQVECVRTHRTAVLKILETQYQDRADVVARFRHFIASYATVSHPVVSRLLEASEPTASRPWLVVEQRTGLHLDAFFQKRPLSEAEFFPFLRRVLEVLHQMHTHKPPLIHGDIHPHALILNQGQLSLVDWGYLHQLPSERSRPVSVVKQAHQAPELEVGQPTVQSDLYSLGMTFTALLAGKPAQRLPRKGHNLNWEALGFSEAATHILRALTHPNPDRRPNSAIAALEWIPQPVAPAVKDNHANSHEDLQANETVEVLHANPPQGATAPSPSPQGDSGPGQDQPTQPAPSAQDTIIGLMFWILLGVGVFFIFKKAC